MAIEGQLHAIRHAVALSEIGHQTFLRVSGERAFDAVDKLCSANLYLRDGQMLLTLLLHDDVTPFADLSVARDDEDFLLIAEGPTARELLDYIDAHLSDV